MKTLASLLLLSFSFLLASPAKSVEPGAHARTKDVPTFNPEQVPAEGRRPQDFVPRRWKIGAREEGDLNGDRLPDHALQLVPENYDSSGISAAPEAQALLILLSSDS